MKDYEKYNKIVRAKIPCETEWRKLISADNDAGYFAVLKNNIAWLVSNNIASRLIDCFTAERLAEQNIYFNGSYSIENKFGVALDNSTVEAWDNSTVKAWGNSTVKALDNSTVEALGNSTIIFRLYGKPKFSYHKEKSIFVILKDELNAKTHIVVNGVETVIENPK